jgi:hypothetical protein
MFNMIRFGRIMLYVGIALIVVGMLAGFTVMFINRDNSAIAWLGLVPIGFISVLTGLVGILLSGPTDKGE